MDLEGITLSEISQTEKERQIPYDLTYMWNLKKVELTETESKLVVIRGWEVREMGRCWSKGTNFQLKDE